MAEKLTDEQVADLLTILRKDISVDAKVQLVSAVKSAIKQHNVPDTCVAPLLEALRVASSSQHTMLANAGFTALNHLLTRLSRQDPKHITRDAKNTLPLVVDKMGDQKDKLRTLAVQALTTMYGPAPADVERFVRNVALVGKNPRAKETGMQWLLQMHNEHGMPFRAYVPSLMELLEDADGMVRDCAKSTVIQLFRDAPNAAKSDVKRQLKNFKVRPAIEAAIVKELAPSGTTTRVPVQDRPDSAPLVRPKALAASTSSLATERPVTPAPPEAKADAVEPSYVNTSRELDDILRDMHPWFEGRESEQNWLKREESIIKLRRLIAGNVPESYPDIFIAGCRSLLDGIIKAATSLRTSLSKEGCSLVQDLALAFGPAMDPMVELLMQTFIKLCAATKKIASTMASTTVDTMIGKVTYNARIMQHVWMACQDKNVQPRTYATTWLNTLIRKEAHHKAQFEHSGGLDMMDKCIKKGLADPNPGVREKMRATYWAFAAVWPAKAEALMDTLDPTAQKLLQKDPNNPNSPKKGAESAARPGLGLSKSTMGPNTKPSLRDTMMAQKRALGAGGNRKLPSRPGSAMATIQSPQRSTTSGSSSSGAPSTAGPTSQTRAKATTGGMSHAPMRPARRRPEMAPRPATAGPYSGRNHDGPPSERSTPADSKPKTATPKIAGSPKRTVPKSRPGHQPTLSEPGISSPTRQAAGQPAAATIVSPRGSPVRARTNISALNSPSRTNEDLTFVQPNITSLQDHMRLTSPRASQFATAVSSCSRSDALEPEHFSRRESTGSHGRFEGPNPAELHAEPNRPGALDGNQEHHDAEIFHHSEGPKESAQIAAGTPSESVKVYEDPVSEADQASTRPVHEGTPNGSVLEDRPVNEAPVVRAVTPTHGDTPSGTPDKNRQATRLLESGITRIKAQSLDVHGFRKLQSLIRDNKGLFTDDTFDALLVGLFQYLESPLSDLTPAKVQDVRAQVLATIKLILKKMRSSFQPHVSRGLEALLAARAFYDSRTHMVSGLELLADELVTLGDAEEVAVTMTRRLGAMEADSRGCRSLSMGLHVLKQLLDTRPGFTLSDAEIMDLATLASRCLESKESGVRMDAVQLCVAVHSRVGEQKFWDSMKGVKDDPKSLITYYVVKRQREMDMAAAA